MKPQLTSKIAIANLVLQGVADWSGRDRNWNFSNLASLPLTSEGTLRYHSGPELMKLINWWATRYTRHLGGPKAYADIDFEYLVIDEELPPHYHERSDSVILVLDDESCPIAPFEALCGVVDDNGVPTRLFLDGSRLLLLPRGLVHGFRRTGSGKAPLHLIAASYPSIAEGDTHYYAF